MDLTVWLLSVVDLFDMTLDAIYSVPVLRFFLALALCLTVFAFLGWLIWRGARRRL